MASEAILLHLSPEGLLPNTVMNYLGMTLDLEPAVFSYLTSRGIRGQQGRGREEFGLVPWVQNYRFLEFGKDSILMLRAIEGRRPQTVGMSNIQP